MNTKTTNALTWAAYTAVVLCASLAMQFFYEGSPLMLVGLNIFCLLIIMGIFGGVGRWLEWKLNWWMLLFATIAPCVAVHATHDRSYSTSDLIRVVQHGMHQGEVKTFYKSDKKGIWQIDDVHPEPACDGSYEVEQGEGDSVYYSAQGFKSPKHPHGIWLVYIAPKPKLAQGMIKGAVTQKDHFRRGVYNAAGKKGCTIANGAPMIKHRPSGYSEIKVWIGGILMFFGIIGLMAIINTKDI